MQNRSKYHSKKVFANGEKFDSMKEYKRFRELSLLEKEGKIRLLKRQVSYLLIPSQYVAGKLVERSCSYKADFVYFENDQLVVEDTKGFKTPEYIMKRKLMLERYGIQIKET